MECAVCLQEGLHNEAEYRVYWCRPQNVTTQPDYYATICGMCGYGHFAYLQIVSVEQLVKRPNVCTPEWIPRSAEFLSYKEE